MQKTSFFFLLLLVGISFFAFSLAFSQLDGHRVAIKFLGLSAIFLLSASLMIGPLATLMPQAFAAIVECRRAVGISSFVFAALHAALVLALYFNYDLGSLLSFKENLLILPGFAILFALAATSSDFAMKALGAAKWKALQYFVYPAFLLAILHFALKSGILEGNIGAEQVAVAFALAAALLLQALGAYARIRRKKEAQ